MTGVAYCTREQVQAALNKADTFRSNTRIDAVIRAAARDLEAWTHRRFYPVTATRYPDWRRRVRGSVLDLDSMEYELTSLDTVTVDGTELTEGTDFYLDPEGGPPYTSIRLLDTSSASWSSTDRGNVLVGQFGASATTRPADTLAGGINSSVTTLTVSDSSLVGVGDLLTIGAERLNVVNKTTTDTTATVAADLAANAGARTLTVSDGTLIHEGELITVGAERLFVEAIAGNVLTVRRAENGSVLAAHATSDVIYAPRLCTVERAATGTTAASHSDGATILANDPPGLVNECSLAMSLVMLEQGSNAYGRVLGSGDNQREATGRSLQSIIDDVVMAYGRIRSAAV